MEFEDKRDYEFEDEKIEREFEDDYEPDILDKNVESIVDCMFDNTNGDLKLYNLLLNHIDFLYENDMIVLSDRTKEKLRFFANKKDLR